jgi:SAM-dependent methyltransferase
VIAECRRVLRPDGALFIEEPSERVLKPWDAVLKWGHPPEVGFGLAALEHELDQAGFEVTERRRRHFFGYYRAVCTS